MAAVARVLGAIDNDPLANIGSLAETSFVQRVGQVTGLTCLPAHFHEVLLSTVLYSLVYVSCGLFAPQFVPSYRQLSRKHRLGFDSHVVSHVNAILLCALSLPLAFNPRLDTLVSYTPYAGFVAATAIGYFVWDVYFTVRHFKYNGPGFVAHAATALFVFAQALRPFMFNYATPFIWFEASTPFVNIHWFSGRVPGMVSESARKLNGLMLLVVFFLCRIVSGPYHGYLMFQELWKSPPASVPTSVVLGVFLSYLTLVGLNFVWFSKMVKLALQTFSPAKSGRAAPVLAAAAPEFAKDATAAIGATGGARGARKRKV